MAFFSLVVSARLSVTCKYLLIVSLPFIKPHLGTFLALDTVFVLCPKTRIIEKVLVLCCAYSTPVPSRRVVSFIHLYNAFLVLLTTYLLCICTALYSVDLNHIIANLKSTQETPAVVWVLHAARRHHPNDVLVLSGRRKASVAV